MSRQIKDLTGQRFGRLTVLSKTDRRVNGRVVWHCRCACGNEIDVVSSYLIGGDTRSCGCLRIDSLRQAYDSSSLFKDKEPRRDSSTGYRGVSRYLTRKNKKVRYRAWITAGGKRYYKSGFKTPSEAYYQGRLLLEQKYLDR